jgi:Zn-dependent protease
MSSFFHYVNRTGYDHIYNSFSPAHIIIVIGFFLGFAWIARTSRKPGSGKLMRRLEKISLTVMASGQITYMIWFALSGSGGDKWPLYACRIACILLIFTYFVRWMPLAVFDLYGALRGDQLGILFYAETLCLPACDKDRFFCHAYRAGLFCTSAYPES